jgi:hypothetical protein
MQETEFLDESLGCKAVLRSNVNAALLSQLKSRNVVDLELNTAKGWSGNLNFLAELPSLKKLNLIGNCSDADLSQIQDLTELTDLSLSTYSKTKIDFRLFPKLTRCSLEWHKGFSTIFEVKGLKKLFLSRYNNASSAEFEKLKELEELSLKVTSIKDLSGISKLNKLRFLLLGLATKLTSLESIECLSKLEELQIYSCNKIGSIHPVSALQHLQTLFIIDSVNIESLKPIDSIKELKTILLYGTTNIADGDLSPLTRQKNLSKVAFQNRKHYSHKNEDFRF